MVSDNEVVTYSKTKEYIGHENGLKNRWKPIHIGFFGSSKTDSLHFKKSKFNGKIRKIKW
jgi:hypothetical protein